MIGYDRQFMSSGSRPEQTRGAGWEWEEAVGDIDLSPHCYKTGRRSEAKNPRLKQRGIERGQEVYSCHVHGKVEGGEWCWRRGG